MTWGKKGVFIFHPMGTLQEELLKSGLITSERVKQLKDEEKKKRIAARVAAEKARAPKPAKPGSGKPKVAVKPKKAASPPKPVEKIHEHHLRTFCDACSKTSPDVEYYQHANRRLDKYWLCVRCADENNILDDTRQTHQSPQAQKKSFLRGYGATKVF